MLVILRKRAKALTKQEQQQEIRKMMFEDGIIPINPTTGRAWIIEHVQEYLAFILEKMRDRKDRGLIGDFILELPVKKYY